MSLFFKFEGPSLPCPHHLNLGQFYSIQRQVVKDFLEAVYLTLRLAKNGHIVLVNPVFQLNNIEIVLLTIACSKQPVTLNMSENISGYSTISRGNLYGENYRTYFQENGKIISPMHDIPLT